MLFNKGDHVLINKQNSYIGKGTVFYICKTIDDLQSFFNESHPHYSKYALFITNNKPIYIVNLDGDMGQAGCLEKELSTYPS